MPDVIPTVHVSDTIRERAGCVRRGCRRVAIVTSQFTGRAVILQHESGVAAITPDGPKTLGCEETLTEREANADHIVYRLMVQHRAFDKAASEPLPEPTPNARVDPATIHGQKHG
jgi:hypothetical protein